MNLPSWLETLILKIKAETSHFFLLHGNVHDLIRSVDGKYVRIHQVLADIFSRRELLMFYSLSTGLQFATPEMEQIFRGRYCKKSVKSGSSAVNRAAEQFQSLRSETAPLSDIIGQGMEQILFLENVLPISDTEKGKVVIINAGQNIAPDSMGAEQPTDRISTEVLDRWSRDGRFRDARSVVIMITPCLSRVSGYLKDNQSGVCALRIPKPNEEERVGRWAHHINEGLCMDAGITPELLGRITSGLAVTQIDTIALEAKASQETITLDLVKSSKQKILETEFGDRLKIKQPKWGFDYFGGKNGAKVYALEARDNMLNGCLRRVPMGILASGPPGTGKTFFFECWAYECGFNFVEIANAKEMWVGKSEENMEKMLAALDDLSPVIVIEDEADQSEPPRDAPDGSSGVNQKLRQMKFQFRSDPRRRGKIVWVMISNRPDLIDAAYKRKGRTDDIIPFVLPGAEEYASIFKVMFSRYGIPTKLKNFSPFAKKVASKTFCSGADVEWMVLEADKLAGREGKNEVEASHLHQAIDDWENSLDPDVIDRQTILAIKGSSKRLRPENWQEILSNAEKRLAGRPISEKPLNDALFPGISLQ